MLPSRDRTSSRSGYEELVVRGGFPEAVRRERPEARRRWLANYANMVADRDLADLVRLRQPGVFRAVLASAAARTGQILHLTDIANDLRSGRDAVRSSIELLTDSGLASALHGLDTTPFGPAERLPRAVEQHARFG